MAARISPALTPASAQMAVLVVDVLEVVQVQNHQGLNLLRPPPLDQLGGPGSCRALVQQTGKGILLGLLQQPLFVFLLGVDVGDDPHRLDGPALAVELCGGPDTAPEIAAVPATDAELCR